MAKDGLSPYRTYKLRLLEETLQEGLDPTKVTIHTRVMSMTFDKIDYFNFIQKYHNNFNIIINPEAISVATKAAATTQAQR